MTCNFERTPVRMKRKDGRRKDQRLGEMLRGHCPGTRGEQPVQKWQHLPALHQLTSEGGEVGGGLGIVLRILACGLDGAINQQTTEEYK